LKKRLKKWKRSGCPLLRGSWSNCMDKYSGAEGANLRNPFLTWSKQLVFQFCSHHSFLDSHYSKSWWCLEFGLYPCYMCVKHSCNLLHSQAM
jgi:hypothetical protein